MANDSGTRARTRWLASVLLVVAGLLAGGALCCGVANKVLAERVRPAIEKATSLQELGTVMGSPEYRIAIASGNVSMACGVLAIPFAVAGGVLRRRSASPAGARGEPKGGAQGVLGAGSGGAGVRCQEGMPGSRYA